MLKIILILLISLSSQVSFASADKTYLRADYGMGKFTTDKLEGLNAKPSGSTFGLSFGTRIQYIEIGVSLKKSSFKADIIHDSATNKIIHNGTSFGLDLGFFVNNHLSLKIGYAFNKYEQKLETALSSMDMIAIRSIYGIEENYSSSNVFYGANVDLFAAQKFDIYVSVLHFPLGDNKQYTTAQLGLRLYMNTSFFSFFGAN